MDKVLAIGLMSGTSLDGIDAVLVEIHGINENIKVGIIDSYHYTYTKKERETLLNLCNPKVANLEQICSINMYLGEVFGNIVNKLLDQSGYKKEDITFISSHGQTIYHHPKGSKNEMDIPGTLQIGDISVLSETTGISVVGDFRTADMAAKGQGAPLVSYVDYLLFNNNEVSRAVQNIGGIGNVTYVPKNSLMEDVQSFDTGPGNMVIDEVVWRVTKGEKTYDKDGKIASKGKVNQELLDMLMSNEYFLLPPPKTTGRELFGKEFVDNIFEQYGRLRLEDLVATVTDFTCLSIANSYNRYFVEKGFIVDQLIVGGGGSNNPFIIKRLKDHMPNVEVLTHESFNLSSDLKEAMAFAILGYQCLLGQYNTIPSATGAKTPVIMGKISYTQPSAMQRIEKMRRVLV